MESYIDLTNFEKFLSLTEDKVKLAINVIETQTNVEPVLDGIKIWDTDKNKSVPDKIVY